MGRCGGYETACLGQQGDQGVLAQEGRFTGHVRTGQQPDCGVVLGRKVAVVGDKGRAALFLQSAFHDGVAAADDVEGAAVVDAGCAPVQIAGQIGKGAGQVDFRQGAGRLCDAVGVVEHGSAQGFKQRLFDLKRATAGVQDAGFKLGQVNGREPNGVRGGLTMDKGFVQGCR